MKLTENFFNVCQTAILNCTWKGSEAKMVYLALQELERLQSYQETKNDSGSKDGALPQEIQGSAATMPTVASTVEDIHVKKAARILDEATPVLNAMAKKTPPDFKPVTLTSDLDAMDEEPDL